jgi:hypothetical protein
MDQDIVIPLKKFLYGECQDCCATFATPEEALKHQRESFENRPDPTMDGHCVTTHWEL